MACKINPTIHAKRDAEDLVNVLRNAVNRIWNLAINNSEYIDFEESYGDDKLNNCYILANDVQNDLISKTLYSTAIEKLSANLLDLYRFVVLPINDRQLLSEAKKTLIIIDTLLECNTLDIGSLPDFDLRGINNELDYGFTRLFAASKYAHAKCKILEEGYVTVQTLSLLADMTPMGVIQAIKRGHLKSANKIGNTWAIKSDEAIDWLINKA